ncbi:MAG: hypothetical protein ACKVQC_06365 [Elusimicrobiota bacterium]
MIKTFVIASIFGVCSSLAFGQDKNRSGALSNRFIDEDANVLFYYPNDYSVTKEGVSMHLSGDGICEFDFQRIVEKDISGFKQEASDFARVLMADGPGTTLTTQIISERELAMRSGIFGTEYSLVFVCSGDCENYKLEDGFDAKKPISIYVFGIPQRCGFSLIRFGGEARTTVSRETLFKIFETIGQGHPDKWVAEALAPSPSWSDFFRRYQRYGYCDDNDTQLSFSRSASLIFTQQWDQISYVRNSKLADPSSFKFVLRHIDATWSADSLNQLRSNAETNCLDRLFYGEICEKLKEAAEAAIAVKRK